MLKTVLQEIYIRLEQGKKKKKKKDLNSVRRQNANAKCGILILFFVLLFIKRVNAENIETKIWMHINSPLMMPNLNLASSTLKKKDF